MRLFSTWSWLLSISNEEYVQQVQVSRQSTIQPTIKQEVNFSDSASATIASGDTLTVDVTSWTTSLARLLDVSCAGSYSMIMVQGGVTTTVPILGTEQTPARATMSLGPNVTALQFVSQEGSNATDLAWSVVEFIDITNFVNFPVI